jgi:hypothetical protein
MKCSPVQAGQTRDSKVWSGNGGLFSFSHIWTFMPVRGHRKTTFAMTLDSASRNCAN